MTNKELKKQISKLRKLKNEMHPNSSERIELHRKIKAMKEELEQSKIIDQDKQPIIKEIKKLDPLFERLQIDLNKFTKEELEKHLRKLKEKSV
jgi:predicted RNase H-like nuclease (RuvC/YqgF family)